LIIEVDGLARYYGKVKALDGISFRVEEGETFGLLGPNGAGKTTLMEILCGLRKLDQGTVKVSGFDLTKDTRRVRGLIGFCPQETLLYDLLSVRENLLFSASLYSMDRSKFKERLEFSSKVLGVGEFLDRRVSQLSGGMKRRANLAASIIHDPPIVILDEPFSGLDPVNQILFKDIFAELRAGGKTVVFSTHQMDQAERLSDSLCLINRGRVVLGGTVREVKRRYGTNSLRVEFTGDGSFMSALPGVRRAMLFGNAAELELAPGADVRPLIAAMNGSVEINRFELVEPSLQSIFIQIVGGAAAGTPAGDLRAGAA